jgi:hypothetical protein
VRCGRRVNKAGEQMADAIPYEKFFPAIPPAGTTIAVFFDVGYFEGVGSYYFTFFH